MEAAKEAAGPGVTKQVTALISLFAMVAGGVAGAIGMRDAAMESVKTTLRAEFSQSLQSYLTRVDFLEFRRVDKAERDQQHYEVLQAIQELKKR